MDLTSREQKLTSELIEVLHSSFDLSEVLSRAQGVMAQLFPAEHLAMCVSKPGLPAEYDWVVQGRPAALFARYHEIASEDFVRDAVMRRPNVVLRDTEMLPRNKLERSPLYRFCREQLDLPLKHVMSVLLLDLGEDWHGGFTLYREQPHPFSERDQALLQWLKPHLASSIRNCRRYGAVATGGQILDALLRHHGAECIVLSPPHAERMRTSGATALLEKWFARSECGPSRIPVDLLERLRLLGGLDGVTPPHLDTWIRSGTDKNLKVTFVPLPQQQGQSWWALVLQEFSHAIPLPADMRQELSPREAEIVALVLSNWPNALIAQELDVTLNTVKTHLRNIFPRLGVESRTDLMYQAAWRRKPFE